MDIQRDKLDIYIKEMAHYDPDNMEMGARAVSQLVVSGQLGLDDNPDRATIIRQAFIKQMESDNYNVHAHAIKCVADMISKLPSNQVQVIFQKTIKSIADPNLDEKKRQIYGVCAGTMIHQTSEQFGPILSELFVDSVKALLQSKDLRVSVQIMLIDVISEFIRKWPNVAGDKKVVFNRKKLIGYLLNNIECRPNYQLIRKSQSALGKLSMILNHQDLVVVLNEPKLGLVQHLKRTMGKYDSTSLKLTRQGVTCLSYVLKTHNPQLKLWVLQLTHLLLEIIRKYSKQTSMDQIDMFCDIIEGALVCQAYIIKSFPRELNELFLSTQQPLSQFVNDLINFDVEGMISYVSIQGNTGNNYAGEQQDYQYYADDNQMEEKCWKVRRAVLHYITVLVKKDKAFRDKTAKAETFIHTVGSKLIQQNSMVNEAAVQTFNSLIEAIIIQKHQLKEEDVEQLSLMRVKSSETDIANMILSELQSRIGVIFSSSKFNDQIKGSVQKLTLRIINLFKYDLTHHPKLVQKILHQVQNQFNKTTVIQNKLNLLLILRELIFENVEFKNYEKTLAVFIKMTANSNFKMASTAYKGIFKMLSEFSNNIVEHKDFELILKNICAKLKQHDIDKIVKKSVMKCAGCILELHFQKLKQFMQNQFLEAINQKLKIQIEKGYILSQLTRIKPTYKVKNSQVKIFTEILRKVIECLGSMNFDLNLHAVQSTKRIIQILQDNLDRQVVNEVLQKTKPLLNEANLPSYLNVLMVKFPGQFKPYIEPIIKTADIDIILNLINLKITDPKSCIFILKSTARQDKAKKISFILGKIGASANQFIKEIDDSLWGQISLGALGHIGNENNYPFILNLIRQAKSEEIKFQACSALGNIASRSHDTIVPLLMNEADKNPDCYLYIYTLREMLTFTNAQFKDIQKLTDWLFAKSENRYEGQSVYYVISQCIGKISMLSSKVLRKALKDAGTMSDNKRYIFANSLRFAFEDRQNLMDLEEYFDYVRQIVEYARDPSVQVRHGSMKSLCSIVGTNSNFIKPSVDDAFWMTLKNNLLIDESLIIEVDYGITKDKKDTGKPLRLQSFNFLKLAINKFPIEGQAHELMQVCLEKIDKQTSSDLILKRINTIKILCEKDFSNFISLQNEFKNKLGIEEGILKNYTVQKEAGDERTDVFLKGIFKEILEISAIAEKEDSDQIRGFISHIRAVQRYNAILDSLQNR